MITVVTPENRDLHQNLIEQMFAQRYEVFIEKLGWDLDCEVGREVDQYDDDKTIYLIATENGRAVAGSRLRPSMAPHLLDEVFPHLVDGQVPMGGSIWELSRGYILPTRPSREKFNHIAAEIMAAATEVCLLNGVDQLTFITETAFIPGMLARGWQVVPLGLPVDDNGTNIIAGMVTVTLQSWNRVMRCNNLNAPIIGPDRLESAA